MPSITHEGLLQPFQHRPELAAELLGDALGVKLPAWQHAALGPTDLTDVVPTEFRADTVVMLYRDGAPARDSPCDPDSPGEGPVQAVVLEVQLDRDARKRYAWPVYLATLRARLSCPTALLVVCPRAGTAAWCADPIDLGHPDWVLTPLVLGPEQTPVVTDPAQARRSPDLAVLSALAHGGAHPERHRVLDALVRALATVGPDRADVYHDVVCAVLPEAARRYLEELMSTGTYQFRSEFALRYINRGRTEGRTEGRAEGRAEGEARAVLTVLAARGIEVPEDVRQQITACTDLTRLEGWLRRAASADSLDQVLEPSAQPAVGEAG